ncbi:hypothetical protein BR93DRAFT_929053, partial [Coniochaeta sp. PMI_546]
MHLPTILSALAVIFPRANAASIPRQDPHVVDFRTWGSNDCSSDNQGIWTFTQSDLTGCKSFSSYGVDVRSISLVDIDYANNHTLQVFYASDDCSTDGGKYYFPSPGQCYGPAGGLKSFLL